MVVVPIIAERITDPQPRPVRAGGPGPLQASVRHQRLNPVINNPSSIINSRAFTLIELLVVIGIVALLMAVLLPTLQCVRSQARAVACQANLHQWALLISMYADENDGRLPEQYVKWGVPLDGSWAKHYFASSDINSYHNDFVLCPMARRWEFDPDRQEIAAALATDHKSLVIAGSKSTAWCRLWPAPDGSRPPFEFSGSYGFNAHSSALSRDGWPASARNNVPILLDCAGWHAGTQGQEPPAYEDDISPGTVLTADMKYFCINRHNGGVNSLFLDWSVRKVGLKELWTLKWYRHFDTADAWTKAGGVQPEDWPQWMRRFPDY